MNTQVATEETDVPLTTDLTTSPPKPRVWPRLPLHYLEPIAISLSALVASLILFSLFILVVAHANPIESMQLMYRGSFGTAFSWQNTLIRAAPLMLTGLCTALPLRLGMVIIGGEGALVLGALAAAGTAHLMPNSSSFAVLVAMMLAGSLTGACWIALAGSLKYYRGVNETICSLLLNYIAIAILNQMVEGPMHDPESLNTPSTWYIGDANMLGKMFGTDVHWGLGLGLIICIVTYLLMDHTVIGFAARIAGGNIRAARVAGLSVGKITVFICALAGAAAGLAGTVEVAAIQGRANANITAPGYGYTGILVAFIARANPLAVIPVSILIGGIGASGGLLQRRQHLPDATVLVLQGILFLMILTFETFYGRFKIFQRKEPTHA
ncbi:MAG TPA: ABC transporter permease [Tepidisphaeraceae bacterium]|nr:ABC transporter permease [Tepidisphaeraceae bacterium]